MIRSSSSVCRGLLSVQGAVAIVLALCVSLLLGASAASADQAAASESLDHKIGQLLMVGFRGMVLDDEHPILRDVRRYHLGGVILFDYDVQSRRPVRNISSPQQLKSLIASLQQVASTPLLVAVDQEGGRVARLKPAHGFGSTLSHTELGQLGDPRLTSTASAKIAAGLAEMGINVNFAPVVDLCSNPDNPVIARLGRCFAPQADKVTRHAREFIQAHQLQGVTAVIKHFPGHGSSQGDSHLGFTDVSTSWMPAELGPFAELIDTRDVTAVMTAHVFNATLDADHPATLSFSTITGILRDQLGFNGVVFSDDLQMGAITAGYGLEQAVRLALEAGIDVLLFGNNLDYDPDIVPKVVTIIRHLLATGVISADRIDQSYRRIQHLKGFTGFSQ